MRWISPFCTGIAPVSGCTFNTHLYDPSYFNHYSNTGLYYDTILMLLLATKGHIKWLGSSCLLMIREHSGRLTEISSTSDELLFVNSVSRLYNRSLKVNLLLNFYLYSRLRYRARINRSHLSFVDSYRYYTTLFRCFIHWPRRVPALILSKIIQISSPFSDII